MLATDLDVTMIWPEHFPQTFVSSPYFKDKRTIKDINNQLHRIPNTQDLWLVIRLEKTFTSACPVSAYCY